MLGTIFQGILSSINCSSQLLLRLEFCSPKVLSLLKFIYSEKATKFCEIFTTYLTTVKSEVKISQNFVAFSEYMNFKTVFARSSLYLWKQGIFYQPFQAIENNQNLLIVSYLVSVAHYIYKGLEVALLSLFFNLLAASLFFWNFLQQEKWIFFCTQLQSFF